jgi:hypothetical protein
MKRSVSALGVLGLVYVLALPGANAAELWKPDLSTGKLVGPMVDGKEAAIYTQLGSTATLAADDTTRNNPGIKPFVVITDKDTDVIHDNTCACNKAAGWLDSGQGDGVACCDLDEDPATRTAIGLLLTGNPAWADVAVQATMNSLNQQTGVMSLVLRATPKTKPEDPDSFYEFRYSTDNAVLQLQSEVRDGIPPIADTSANPDGTEWGVNVRILKVVNGKWSMLAQQNAAGSPVYIPRVYRAGIDHDVNKDPADDGNGADALTGGVFRFVAKGNLLQAFVGLPGQPLQKVLEVSDSELKAGLVGFATYEYRALYKDILVEDAP